MRISRDHIQKSGSLLMRKLAMLDIFLDQGEDLFEFIEFGFF
jgi:hypothetical protein